MRALYPSISMIYSDSNVDLDGFKSSAYATRVVDVFGKEFKEAAEWNWLKQEREIRGCVLKTRSTSRPPVEVLIFAAAPGIRPATGAFQNLSPHAKGPGSLRGLRSFCSLTG